MKSLEKKPVVKGKPHKQIKQTRTAAATKGELFKKFELLRNSCLLSPLWINKPEHINKEALNKACETKWKKPKTTNPKEIDLIIKPNWLKVDRAITFFKSHSKLAITPAKIKVNKATTNKVPLKIRNTSKNRIVKKIPAVTNVEEWTKEDTGVGAAIAAGNQEEKGTCALLVIKAKNIKKKIVKSKVLTS